MYKYVLYIGTLIKVIVENCVCTVQSPLYFIYCTYIGTLVSGIYLPIYNLTLIDLNILPHGVNDASCS